MTDAKEAGGKRQGGPAGFEMVGELPGTEEALPVSMTFGTFVLSLSTSALVLLGEARDPGSDKDSSPNLPLARQTIDVLEMLSEKTRGNLDPEEEKLLAAILHDLRMRYVRIQGAGG